MNFNMRFARMFMIPKHFSWSRPQDYKNSFRSSLWPSTFGREYPYAEITLKNCLYTFKTTSMS